MNKLLEFLAGNPWLNLVFLVLAVGGIVTSYVFYRKSLRSKSLVFSSSSFNLIHERLSIISDLTVKYKNCEVGRLTVNRIAIWNRGKEPIRRDDIAQGDPLRIEIATEGIEILSASINRSTNTSNQFSLIDGRSKILVLFDYLNYGDGVLIDVFHTGAPGKSLTIQGTIIGGDDLAYATNANDDFSHRTIRKILWSLPRPENPKLRKFVGYAYGILLVPIILPLVILLWPYSYYRLLSDRSPRCINPFSLGVEFDSQLK